MTVFLRGRLRNKLSPLTPFSFYIGYNVGGDAGVVVVVIVVVLAIVVR